MTLFMNSWRYLIYKFSPNAFNGWVDEVRSRTKQSLLRMPWHLPSDRKIPDSLQNLETKVERAHIAGHGPPRLQTSTGLQCGRRHRPQAIPVWNKLRAPKRLETGSHYRLGAKPNALPTGLEGWGYDCNGLKLKRPHIQMVHIWYFLSNEKHWQISTKENGGALFMKRPVST